ncbi:MAG: flagellar protein FliS [Lachnospiraceae bacterium]|nr:flagellar protein FliS [Lachnospiraceae bacterium]MCI7596367.1 flagellar protein FliS [Lachnospiraceae bacterium]MDY3222002.1 flagellar protein FliS [Lachnospiraceae bacterium]
MTKEKKQEFTLRITQANKTQLIVILYEMTLAFLEDASLAFDTGDKQEYKKNVRKAKDCLDELIASLDLNYEIALSLHSLYYFYKRQLSSAAIQEKKELLKPVEDMLKELKQSYEKVASQDTSAPLMENAQVVYAGLTYGKGSLNVDLADQSTNRGFRI